MPPDVDSRMSGAVSGNVSAAEQNSSGPDTRFCRTQIANIEVVRKAAGARVLLLIWRQMFPLRTAPPTEPNAARRRRSAQPWHREAAANCRVHQQ